MLPKSRDKPSGPLGLVLRIMLNSHFVRIVLLGAVVLGVIAGVSQQSVS